jgi:hypothetical protein
MYLVGSKCAVLGSKFDSNVGEKGGGAIYVKFSTLRIDSTDFVNNTAPVGGAVAVYECCRTNSHSSVVFTNSSLLDNAARPVKAAALQEQLSSGSYYTLGVGGALYLERSDVSIAGSKLLRNRAVMDGGEWGEGLQQRSTAQSSAGRAECPG